jgi:hypothetical protein
MPLQFVWPAGQQMPLEQLEPDVHAVPQAPQLAVLALRSTHDPPQLVCPDAQQTPLEQVDPDAHAT